jgi:hypothetical protein
MSLVKGDPLAGIQAADGGGAMEVKPKSYTLVDFELLVAGLKSRMVPFDGNGSRSTTLFIDKSEVEDIEALHRLMLLLVNRKKKVAQVLRGRPD